MWAERGECKSSDQYMKEHCLPSCGGCTPKGPRPKGASAYAPAAAAAASPAAKEAVVDVTQAHAEQQALAAANTAAAAAAAAAAAMVAAGGGDGAAAATSPAAATFTSATASPSASLDASKVAASPAAAAADAQATVPAHPQPTLTEEQKAQQDASAAAAAGAGASVTSATTIVGVDYESSVGNSVAPEATEEDPFANKQELSTDDELKAAHPPTDKPYAYLVKRCVQCGTFTCLPHASVLYYPRKCFVLSTHVCAPPTLRPLAPPLLTVFCPLALSYPAPHLPPLPPPVLFPLCSRCTDFKGLHKVEWRDCVRAASLGLEYLRPGGDPAENGASDAEVRGAGDGAAAAATAGVQAGQVDGAVPDAAGGGGSSVHALVDGAGNSDGQALGAAAVATNQPHHVSLADQWHHMQQAAGSYQYMMGGQSSKTGGSAMLWVMVAVCVVGLALWQYRCGRRRAYAGVRQHSKLGRNE